MPEIKVKIEDTIEVDWTNEKEYWNEYELNDGTTLKIKLILKGVRRAKDRHAPDGYPIYMVQSVNVIRASNVPKKLRKKLKPQSDHKVV